MLQEGAWPARVPTPTLAQQPPYLPSTNHLLGGVDSLAAPRAALRATNLLGELGRIGVGGGPVAGAPAWGRTCGDMTYRQQYRRGSGTVWVPPRLHLAQPVTRPRLPGPVGSPPTLQMDTPRAGTVLLSPARQTLLSPPAETLESQNTSFARNCPPLSPTPSACRL